jgi:hypothetical protein
MEIKVKENVKIIVTITLPPLWGSSSQWLCIFLPEWVIDHLFIGICHVKEDWLNLLWVQDKIRVIIETLIIDWDDRVGVWGIEAVNRNEGSPLGLQVESMEVFDFSLGIHKVCCGFPSSFPLQVSLLVD